MALLIGTLVTPVSGEALEPPAESAAKVYPFVLKGSVQYTDYYQPNIVVIDQHPRQLGGSMHSVKRNMPVAKIPFSFDPSLIAGSNITLTIGSVEGINTPEAHAIGQSNASHISSPTTIKINGKKVGFLYTNATNIPVRVPISILKQDGPNMLQIEAGYYFQQNNAIAYDEVAIQNLAIHY